MGAYSSYYDHNGTISVSTVHFDTSHRTTGNLGAPLGEASTWTTNTADIIPDEQITLVELMPPIPSIEPDR